ncbi:MAG TPA: hypothetical protein VK939_06070, partial [Longimicrobiales bacterium]|nr:hypothetical protein [Longimicrobiales bacterium]
EKETPFHAGLSATVRRNCISCHPAHDARIPAAGNNCQFCHAAGGQHAPKQRSSTFREAVSRTAARLTSGRATRPSKLSVALNIPASVRFRHAEHNAVKCASCHEHGRYHGDPTVKSVAECRSCHHAKPASANCLGCHDRSAIAATRTTVKTRLAIRIGDLRRPERELPFDHARHLGEACTTCHTEGLHLGATAPNCSGCHEQHHRPDAQCTTCHEPPAAVAHDRRAHLGCGGIGCHEGAITTVDVASQPRNFCLSCHQDRAEHRPEGTCGECHKLPSPRRADPARRTAAALP